MFFCFFKGGGTGREGGLCIFTPRELIIKHPVVLLRRLQRQDASERFTLSRPSPSADGTPGRIPRNAPTFPQNGAEFCLILTQKPSKGAAKMFYIHFIYIVILINCSLIINSSSSQCHPKNSSNQSINQSIKKLIDPLIFWKQPTQPTATCRCVDG